MKHTKLLIISLMLAACGAGDEKDETASTQVHSSQCGDIALSIGETTDIIEAAKNSGVEVEDYTGSYGGGLDQVTPIQPVAKDVAPVLVFCGGEYVNTTTTTTTSISNAEELKRAISAGLISKVEVYHGMD